MDDFRRTRWKRLSSELSHIAWHLTHVRVSPFAPQETWQPSINAYRCSECISICVDLAGVEASSVQLQVKALSLRLRGVRLPPEPCPDQKTMQVLAMEIDYGKFDREIFLPQEVEPAQIVTEQKNGLLWIYLPLRAHA